MDLIKTNCCKKETIQLLRIDYTEINNIEDILYEKIKHLHQVGR